MEVVTMWVPIFWIDAGANVLTALLSAWVAIMLVRRASAIGFGVNDYAARLANTGQEKRQMKESLLPHRSRRIGIGCRRCWHTRSTILWRRIQNALYLIRRSDGVSADDTNLTKTAADEVIREIELSRSTRSFFRQGSEPEKLNLSIVLDSGRFLWAQLIQKQGLVLETSSTGTQLSRASRTKFAKCC
jgi:hypothetical protein